MHKRAWQVTEEGEPPWAPPEAREAFEKHVLRKLPAPSPVTLDELMDAFREHLLVGKGEFGAAYSVFVQSVLDRLQYRVGDVLPVAGYSITDCPAEELADDFPGDWVRGGFRIEFFSGREADDPDWIAALRGRFCGECTENALKAFQEEAYDVVRSILQSYRLGCPAMLEDAPGEDVCGTDGPVSMSRMGEGDEELMCHALACAHRLLTSYFTSPSKADKNHIAFRIRNGLGYLVEADRRKPDALQMVMCVAAMEALLGEKSDKGITDKLARRCAVLLESDRKKRKQAALVVKGIYDRRSSVVHGSDFKATNIQVSDARRLAACVLFEVQEWSDFMQRMEKVPHDTELLRELEDASYEARNVTGLLGSGDCCDLWL